MIFRPRTWILLGLLALAAACASAQDSLRVDSVLTVNRVTLVGNQHTKDFVILREMTLRPGVPITQELMAYDRDRIYSLGLFNRVDLYVVPVSATAGDLVVEVSERWYIFPFPVFGIKDRDWSKVYYGLGLLHANFRGRNEKLYTTIILGYDPSAVLAYRNPFISEEGTYILDSRLSYSKVRNKSILAQAGGENFDEQHFSGVVNLGRRFGIHHTLWLSLGYEVVSVSEYMPARTLSPDGKDHYSILGAGYTYDTRDLQEYPSSGTMTRFSVLKYGFPGGEVNFVRYSADLRGYQGLPLGLVLAGRVFTDLVAAGPTPSYSHAYFGYGERIRGHFKEVMEGENILGASTELHYVLLPPRYFTIGVLPPEFGVWRFGVVAAAFGDAGLVWFRSAKPSLANTAKGYGVGLDFLLPYSAVLRTEYAWNETRQGQFILDIGSTF